MTLLHTNMICMGIAGVLLMVGFSARDHRWGPGVMLLGVLLVLGVIVYDIRVLSGTW